MAVLDGNGKVVSFMPVERMERKRERSTMSAIFSRLAFKKKIDIVKLVAEKDLEPKQLVQIRSAIEKGLSEDQLLVLINNQIPAEGAEIKKRIFSAAKSDLCYLWLAFISVIVMKTGL